MQGQYTDWFDELDDGRWERYAESAKKAYGWACHHKSSSWHAFDGWHVIGRIEIGSITTYNNPLFVERSIDWALSYWDGRVEDDVCVVLLPDHSTDAKYIYILAYNGENKTYWPFTLRKGSY